MSKRVLSMVTSLAAVILLVGGCCCNKFAGLEPAGSVKLRNFYTDNMVFQRNMPIVICGTAIPGGKVCVKLNGSRGRAKVAADGTWKVKLPQQPAGGPYKMMIKGKKQIVLKNIMIGEVWICSGQSNMEFPVSKVYDAKKEIATANYPNIRIYKVRKVRPHPAPRLMSSGNGRCALRRLFRVFPLLLTFLDASSIMI